MNNRRGMGGPGFLVLFTALGGLLLFLCWAYFLSPPGFFRLERWRMDIMAGRICHDKLVLHVRIFHRVEETALSKMYRESVGKPPPPVWMTSDVDRWGFRGSVLAETDFAYTSGSGEILAAALGSGLFTPAARKVAVLRFLSLLQTHPPAIAERYADELMSFAFDHWDQAARGPIDAEDLPPFDPEAPGS